MRSEYLTIRRDIDALRQADPEYRVPGSDSHKYVLNPPLSESQVAHFETGHGISLPTDYREFLLNVGNGGAGPAYGVEQLGQAYNCNWTENPGLVGNLAEPFPYTDRWNAESIDASRPVDEQYRQQDDYWSSRHVNGALPICDLGCNLREILIITGRERGNIWFDGRADWGGLTPDSRDGHSRLSFLDWYEFWLRDSLRIVQGRL